MTVRAELMAPLRNRHARRGIIPPETIDELRDRIDLAAVIRDVGVELRQSGRVFWGLCPLHAENTPSFKVDPDRQTYRCFGCQATGDVISFVIARERIEFREAVELLGNRAGLDLGAGPRSAGRRRNTPPRAPAPVPNIEFSAHDAEIVWSAALARAQDDEHVDTDRDVYDYLACRGLAEAWNERLFGVLSTSTRMPRGVARWLQRGYRVVVPVYDRSGRLASVQSRAITETEPKTLFPRAHEPGPKLFANGPGLRVLRGHGGGGEVVLGEGLTDFLALGAALPTAAVLAIPGTSHARHAIGEWVASARLVIVTDADESGATAAATLAQYARYHGVGELRRVRWRVEGEDASDIVKREGIDVLAKVLEDAMR